MIETNAAFGMVLNVRFGSDSEVIFDFEDVRFDTESGSPHPPAPS
jgi:hypothetical protein